MKGYTKHKVYHDQAGTVVVTKWEQMSSIYRQAYVIGWQEVMEGKDFNPAYDNLEIFVQRNYEYGRLDAANVKASGRKVPFWGSITKKPDEIKWAVHYAHRDTGPARPNVVEEIKYYPKEVYVPKSKMLRGEK